jgi:lipopolysaccharide transport system permease protein
MPKVDQLHGREVGQKFMNRNRTGPIYAVSDIFNNRGLIFSLSTRGIAERYRGTLIGTLWAIFNPLIMLTIYTFIFSVIFRARWNQNQNSGSNVEYALILFIGLIVFQIFSECVNGAPTLVTGNVNYVKKIVFPLEILPLATMGTTLFQSMISLAIWLIAHLLFVGAPPPTAMLFPFILLPFLLLVLGVSWWIAALGVFVRDIAQITGIATSVLFFMSPIFYPISAVPEKFQLIYHLNPITYAVEQSRDVLYFGRVPSLMNWILYVISTSAIAWSGFAWFQKTRKGFADVL